MYIICLLYLQVIKSWYIDIDSLLGQTPVRLFQPLFPNRPQPWPITTTVDFQHNWFCLPPPLPHTKRPEQALTKFLTAQGHIPRMTCLPSLKVLSWENSSCQKKGQFQPIPEARAPVSQSLWEERSLTSVRASKQTQMGVTGANLPLPWLYRGPTHLLPYSLILPLKWPVISE